MLKKKVGAIAIGRHPQHLQAERSFADRDHGRVGVSRRKR